MNFQQISSTLGKNVNNFQQLSTELGVEVHNFPQAIEAMKGRTTTARSFAGESLAEAIARVRAAA